MIAIDTAQYAGAAALLTDADQTAACSALALFDALGDSARSAGRTAGAASWSRAYEDAAGTVTKELSRLIDAFGTCATLLDASGRNQGHAEAASAPYGMPPYAVRQLDLASVGLNGIPTIFGGDHDEPHGWSLILSHLHGYIWPGADLDRLRRLAGAWHTASRQLRALTSYPTQAAAELERLASPELPDAITACQRLGKAAMLIADDCDSLASSCTSFADEMQRHRDPVGRVVGEFFAAIGISEVAGELLTPITSGLSELVSKAVQSGVFATYAARITGLLGALEEDLPGLAPAVVGGDGAWVEAMASAEPVLAEIDTSTSVLASEAELGRGLAGGSSRLSATREEMSTWERTTNSHTFGRHSGRTPESITEEAKLHPTARSISTYPNDDAAVDSINDVLQHYAQRVERWLARGAPGRLPLSADLGRDTGLTALRDGTLIKTQGARVVLVAHEASRFGFRVLTSYPIP